MPTPQVHFGSVTGIRFAFSNPYYARLFAIENQEPIDRKVVEIA